MKKTLFRIAILLMLGTYADNGTNAQTITTVAGSGYPGYSGDGGTATMALLNYPTGIATDGTGNVYIADHNNHCIRVVNASGIISTYAGNGSFGYSGDGGEATAAQLKYPQSIAVDGSGNVYFGDNGNNTIRKIATSGIISTIAGTGTLGFSGDGGPATLAELGGIVGIAIDDSSNIYFAANGRIRKINTSGIISTFAGNGTSGYSGDGGPATSAEFNGPIELTVDSSSNVYIADCYNNCIRRVNASGIVNTIVGTGTAGYSGDGGAATAAKLYYPYCVKMDRRGNLFIADTYNQRIRKVTPTGVISTIAGSGTFAFSGDGGPATSAAFEWPNCVAIDTGESIYVLDQNSGRIRKVNSSGTINTIAGMESPGYSGDGGMATSAQIYAPRGVTIDTSGNMYISDAGNGRIRKVFPSGDIITLAGTGTNGYSGDGGEATAAAIHNPEGIAVDRAGNVIFADLGNNRIRKISVSGIISTIAGNGTAGFSGDGGYATAAKLSVPGVVNIDDSGNIYIVDLNNFRIRKVNTSGIISTIAGNGTFGFSGDGGAATAAELNYPIGVCTDTLGNIYIAEFISRVRKVSSSGIITTIAGNGTEGYSGDGGPATAAEFAALANITQDHAGNLYIADGLNSNIRKINSAGIISTVAGTRSYGYSGDGGPATLAEMNQPQDVAVDRSGNLYIADNVNNRIRKVTVCINPAIGPIYGSSSVCPGSTISLTDTSSGGTWSVSSAGTATINSSGSVTGITPGIDTINYSKTNGCGTTVETDIITVNPLPNAGTITGTTDSVCPGHTISLTDSVTGGLWLSSNTGIATVSAGIVTGLAAGSTTIKYIVTNPCGADTASFSVNVPDHAYCNMGVNSAIQQYDNLSIYPNPNKGSFTISLTSGSSEGAHVIITNMLGQKVKELMVKNNQPTEVQLVVPGGVYFVSTIINTTQVMQKIVVE